MSDGVHSTADTKIEGTRKAGRAGGQAGTSAGQEWVRAHPTNVGTFSCFFFCALSKTFIRLPNVQPAAPAVAAKWERKSCMQVSIKPRPVSMGLMSPSVANHQMPRVCLKYRYLPGLRAFSRLVYTAKHRHPKGSTKLEAGT